MGWQLANSAKYISFYQLQMYIVPKNIQQKHHVPHVTWISIMECILLVKFILFYFVSFVVLFSLPFGEIKMNIIFAHYYYLQPTTKNINTHFTFRRNCNCCYA